MHSLFNQPQTSEQAQKQSECIKDFLRQLLEVRNKTKAIFDSEPEKLRDCSSQEDKEVITSFLFNYYDGRYNIKKPTEDFWPEIFSLLLFNGVDLHGEFHPNKSVFEQLDTIDKLYAGGRDILANNYILVVLAGDRSACSDKLKQQIEASLQFADGILHPLFLLWQKMDQHIEELNEKSGGEMFQLIGKCLLEEVEDYPEKAAAYIKIVIEADMNAEIDDIEPKLFKEFPELIKKLNGSDEAEKSSALEKFKSSVQAFLAREQHRQLEDAHCRPSL